MRKVKDPLKLEEKERALSDPMEEIESERASFRYIGLIGLRIVRHSRIGINDFCREAEYKAFRFQRKITDYFSCF